jgi:hypothetical protein
VSTSDDHIKLVKKALRGKKQQTQPNKYFGRMFLICLIFTLTGCVAFLFMDNKLTGGDFIALALGIPTAFGLKDAALNFIHRGKGSTADD